MFTNNKNSAEKDREQFIQKFQEEHNTTIKKMILSELRADVSVLKYLDLPQSNVWGLIIITDKELYFYKAEQQFYIASLVVPQNNDESLKEKCVVLSSLKNIQFSLPEKGFFDFLNPEKSRIITASFMNEESECKLTFVLAGKAQDYFEYLK